ncbi:hypothetical protein Emin_0094 [Elusimicrobium minutum Pei191]|uniref:Uncharacterized protein n=1 Tax=Elusimicrobium minutum (strain Pei191) TaxID=445932 RepID=B2KAW4_ELUMP|nr:hypothetical protein [Elusimicrobium minutum]ACC97660.1 hypothetical protein Emin_0094 [Elusimicrobium minutum Pei191]
MKKITKITSAAFLAVLLSVCAFASVNIFELAAKGDIAALKRNVSKENILTKNERGESLFHVAKDEATAEFLFSVLKEKKHQEALNKIQIVSKDMPTAPFALSFAASSEAKTEIAKLKDNKNNNALEAALEKHNSSADFYAKFLKTKPTETLAKKTVEKMSDKKAVEAKKKEITLGYAAYFAAFESKFGRSSFQ